MWVISLAQKVAEVVLKKNRVQVQVQVVLKLKPVKNVYRKKV